MNKKDEENRYIAHGYKDRDDYLSRLADNRGIDLETVFMAAELLGDSEDFDGLLNDLELLE